LRRRARSWPATCQGILPSGRRSNRHRHLEHLFAARRPAARLPLIHTTARRPNSIQPKYSPQGGGLQGSSPTRAPSTEYPTALGRPSTSVLRGGVPAIPPPPSPLPSTTSSPPPQVLGPPYQKKKVLGPRLAPAGRWLAGSFVGAVQIHPRPALFCAAAWRCVTDQVRPCQPADGQHHSSQGR
jgi:hypothetical protein